jgi:uncharacterized DUF497 family protein
MWHATRVGPREGRDQPGEARPLLRGGQPLFKSGVDYLEIYDEEHSDEEDRFIAVGPIERDVIVVSYTERDNEVLRILSARLATKNERRRFEAYQRGER